jgi:hypothetical protein
MCCVLFIFISGENVLVFAVQWSSDKKVALGSVSNGRPTIGSTGSSHRVRDRGPVKIDNRQTAVMISIGRSSGFDVNSTAPG